MKDDKTIELTGLIGLDDYPKDKILINKYKLKYYKLIDELLEMQLNYKQINDITKTYFNERLNFDIFNLHKNNYTLKEISQITGFSEGNCSVKLTKKLDEDFNK